MGIVVLAASACGHKGPAHPRDLRQVLLAFDDNRANAALTFPSLTYEALIRFNPPEGKHRPWRLWMLAQAPGTVVVSLYKDTVFTAPGDPIDTFTRDIEARDVSAGSDGRWVVEDLQELDAIDGPIWVGVRKVGGDPALANAKAGKQFADFIVDTASALVEHLKTAPTRAFPVKPEPGPTS